MKTKFGKKLLALFLAVLMALTAFTGAFSAYAASADPSYHDDALKRAIRTERKRALRRTECEQVFTKTNITPFIKY